MKNQRIKSDNYKREKHFTEKGTYTIQDIFTKDIIKNLNINSNYYKNSNYSVIRQQYIYLFNVIYTI